MKTHVLIYFYAYLSEAQTKPNTYVIIMNNITCLVHLNDPNVFWATFNSRYALHFSNFGINSCRSCNLSLSIVLSTLTFRNIL